MSARLAWLGGRWALVAQFVALLAAGVLWVAPRATSWVGSWKQALDFGAGATAFIGPVAAGAACLAYARLRRSAMSEVILQGRRDWWVWLQPSVAVWGLASAALLVLVLGVTGVASAAGAPSYWGSSWIVVPALAVLAAQTVIGAGLGFASGRAWVAPLVAAGVFSISLLTSSQVIPELFNTGGVTGTLAGQVFAVGPVLMPGVAAVGIVMMVLVAAAPRLFWATWPQIGRAHV